MNPIQQDLVGKEEEGESNPFHDLHEESVSGLQQ